MRETRMTRGGSPSFPGPAPHGQLLSIAALSDALTPRQPGGGPGLPWATNANRSRLCALLRRLRPATAGASEPHAHAPLGGLLHLLPFGELLFG